MAMTNEFLSKVEKYCKKKSVVIDTKRYKNGSSVADLIIDICDKIIEKTDKSMREVDDMVFNDIQKML